MHVILDHLSAIVVATILLVVLLTLQIREKLNATDQALEYQLRTRAEMLLDTFGRDVDNMMTQEEAIAAGVSPSTCHLYYDAEGRLQSFSFPSYVERAQVVGFDADSTAQYASFYEPMSVRYDLTPTARRLSVGDSARVVHRLERREFRAGSTPSPPSSGSVEIGSVIDSDRLLLSESVTAVSVELFGVAGRLGSRGVEVGVAPSDLAYVRLSAELAHEALSNLATDQASTRLLNTARVSQTFRPPDLVYAD
ncbi:MAG: hypothetical protein AAF624_11345 [Bacteroidota bacterium]